MLEAIISFLAAAAIVSFYQDRPVGDPKTAVGLVVLSLMTMRLVHAVWMNAAIAVVKRLRTDMAAPKLKLWMFPLFHAAAFIGVLEWSGWSAFVHAQPFLMKSGVLRDAALLLPWFGYFASWQWARQSLHVELRRRPWSKGAFLGFHFRVLLIPLTPFLLNDIFVDVVKHYPTVEEWLAHFPSFDLLVSLVILGVVFVFSPFIIRLGLPMQSMSDGPLRRRFEATAAGAGFRYLDILVCKTEGNMINAAFLGVMGKLRYVVMTDGILATLGEDDLVGVFAHEMGHSHRRHLVLSNALIVGFLLMTHVISLRMLGYSTVSGATGGFVFAGALAAFFVFVFSPIAKRFETEADVYAGEVLRDPQPITRSLCALGDMFPHLRTRGGFIHPSIEARVAFLGEYFKNADLKAAFTREMGRVRKTILFFLGAAVLVWVTQLPQEWRIGHWSMSVRRALLAKDAPEAERLLTKLEGEMSDGAIVDVACELRMWLWQTIVVARQEVGDYAGAEARLAEITAHRAEFRSPVEIYNAASLLAQQAAGTGDWTGLLEHGPAAAGRLQELAKFTDPDDEEMVRETRDVQTFLAALWLLETIGELVPAGEPIAWPELPAGDGPDWVRALKRAIDQGVPPDPALRTDAARAGGDMRWRRDFLERLFDVVQRRAAVTPAAPEKAPH